MISANSVKEAADFITAHTRYSPTVGLILGSGLGELANEISGADVIDYGDVPNFPPTTVPGHAGQLLLGRCEDCAVALLCGRPHYYEGYSMAQIGFPVHVLAEIGCRSLIVTNAAGGLNPTFRASDLMLITDHINLPGMVGANPLIGNQYEGAGERFVAMSDAYDPRLAELALRAARNAGLTMRRGVYVMVSGPNYETSAELRFLRAIGGDAVGMSTAPEVVVARQRGMRVLGISCITNAAHGREPSAGASQAFEGETMANTAGQHPALTHAEVLEQGRAMLPRLAILLRELMRLLAQETEPQIADGTQPKREK
jgi:purine-nucleoside phosphorylase